MPLGPVVAALVAVALGAGCVSTAGPGQRVDLEFQPPIAAPAFDIGAGPVVLIDEAHRNMHTAEGSYKPFAELLRRDGYVVHPSEVPFTPEALARADINVMHWLSGLLEAGPSKNGGTASVAICAPTGARKEKSSR